MSSSVPVPGPRADRVVVLVDYENVHRTGSRRFLPVNADWNVGGHIKPRELAELLVSRRKRPSVLKEVRVYRGRPNPHRQPRSAAAHDRQVEDWQKQGVRVVSRNLQYPDAWPDTPAGEKGIDVALAVDAIRLAMSGGTDVVIIVSHDNDLLPAIETVYELPTCHIEVAAWAQCHRLRMNDTQQPWCHFLHEDDFEQVRDFYDYSQES